MRRLSVILLVVVAISSCTMLEGVFRGAKDRKVARIGTDVLYESTITSLMPPGLSPEDSTAIVESYIRTWALSRLKLKEADEQLSKEEKNVDGEVESFRRNLLSFRYEKHITDSRLDTVVTEAEAREYYASHQDDFKAPTTLVRARLARVSTKSPYYFMIRDIFEAVDSTDVAELEVLCNASAERYADFDKSWITLPVLARELGMTADEAASMFTHRGFYEVDEDQQHHLVYLYGLTPVGGLMPFEYIRARIEETVVAKRKQELLSSLEQDLLDDALVNRKLIIFNHNNEK